MVEYCFGMKIFDFDLGYFSVIKGESFYDLVCIVDVIGVEVVVICYFINYYYDYLFVIGMFGLLVVNGGDGFG